MSGFAIQICGDKPIKALIDSTGKRGRDALDKTLHDVTEDIAKKGKRVAPKKWGTLRRSIHAEHHHMDHEVVAGGPSAPYALKIHEWIPEPNWTEPGTGPKYLERPALEEIKTIPRRVRRHYLASR